MHYRARSYDSRNGRFIQRDPLLFNRAEQHYIYSSNAPNMRSDPSGQQDIVAPIPNGPGEPLAEYKLSRRLSGKQIDKVRPALLAAITLTQSARKVIGVAKADLDKKGTAEYELVKLWFGEIGKKAEIEQIDSKLMKTEEILTNLEATKIRKRMGSEQPAPDLIDFGRLRYVDAGGRAATRGGTTTPWWWTELYNDFFDDGKHPMYKEFFSREGLLLHEATHAGFDSNDPGKSPADTLEVRLKTAKDLAKDPATREGLNGARNNASNYQFFAEDVRAHKLGK